MTSSLLEISVALFCVQSKIMAEEAAVENSPFYRFFCHKCSREIHGVLTVSKYLD